MNKTWSDLHKDEVLSDNSDFENCKQCKTCNFRNDNTVWSNDYHKSCCQIYQYPNCKPIPVIKNTARCEYFNDDIEE